MTVDRGRCADQLDRRRGYARPAVGSRPRSRENLVAECRCARTPHPRCTASDKPYTAPVPTAPLESDHRDSNCGSPCEGTFVVVTFSPIAGASALNMTGPQWVYAIFHGWSPLSTMGPEQSRRVDVRSTNFALYSGQIRTSRCCWTPWAAPRGWRIWRRRPRQPRSSLPTRNSTKIGQDPVRHLLRPFALHE